VPVTDDALESHLVATREGRYDSFRDFLRLRSISALPEHKGDVRQTAEWLASELTRVGVEHAEVSETAGNPVVYADWLHAPGAPTVLVYGHYDVQPVDPLELWTSPPFEPAMVDGRILARGAADDKGHIHGHVMAAEGLLATRGRLPLNVKYLFEGEEEVSSPNLAAWMTANRERLAADVVVISDTGFFEGNLPAITIGLRGMMYAQIDVTGTPVDVHSGGYGGVIENPANALAQIIAALKGPDGRIRIPGFYDDVVPLTEADRAEFADLPFDEEAFRKRTDVPALVGEVGFTVLERKGARPTLDVNGIWGGFTGEGSKTIIPAHAHAKVSCRLVTAQDPDRIFGLLRDYVDEIAPPGVRVSIRLLGAGPPSLTPQDHPATKAAARAIEATFGQAPLYLREGGSIPITSSFESILGLPVVLVGFSQPDEHAHAPNEWLDLENYETGIRMFARLWDELAEPQPSA
jgi:acetylornithine deacetylase/succinyl-diaminopimelate desuccinylase-like protein